MNTFKAIWYIIAMFVFQFLDALKDIKMQSIPSKSVLFGLIIFFVVIMFFFTFNLLKWWKTKIYIEGDTFILERNQLSQSKTTVKLSSISTVNLQQNIFEKIFDVYTLQLDINSSVTANKTDFNLVFDDKTAFAFRDYILASLDKENSHGNLDSEQHSVNTMNQKSETKPIISFGFKDVMRHCVLSFSFLGGIYATAIVIVAIGAFYTSNEKMHHVIMPAIFSLLIAVVPFIYKSVTAFLLYHNFVLEKNGDKLIVSYGLFTRKQFTLPLDKTNALIIKQPFQARFFNLCYGEIINVGMGDAGENQSPIFCLLVKYETLQSVIRQIAPQFVMEGKEQKSPKPAIVPVLTKWALWGILFLAGFIIFYKWWIGLIILIFFIICGILSHATKGLNIDENKLSITTGVFDKRTITTAYSKLQNATAKYGPISRRLGIAHGSVSILSSSANQINDIGYFPKEQFDIISQQIISHDSIN
ncbi:PH domain-containing protein [Aminipila terrae]|uniref:PH domain-containing protein n=1 Tax=Aminipila terrae TaxID=2697030 RepID=A0A6P1M9S5_9FIRM|nr:PH domain-containing protein [Aminipila terrae]QHI71380.1 PH domain-containing protein [Aminipila terrae]